MGAFTITSFTTYAGLLLAARMLASVPTSPDRVNALADLATDGPSLASVLRDTGLSLLAREMARRAEDHAFHFTHPGPARDDALAVFWQVAPASFADPGAFTGVEFDPARTTDRMAAAIKASSHGRDFTTTVLAEPFFRSVTREALAVMRARAESMSTVTPARWRDTLSRHGVRSDPP